MHAVRCAGGLLSVLLAAGGSAAQSREELGEHSKLAILYAGESGSAREKAFVEFLAPLFAKVEAIDLAKLDPKSAADYDVVIADWKRRYPRPPEGTWDSAPGSLSRELAKPIVMIGAVGGEITRELRPKLDWL
jgi:hypothetical protein